MNFLSVQTSASSRPVAAAAAVPRFTSPVVHAVFGTTSATPKAMPLLMIKPLAPSSTISITRHSSSTVACKYTSVPERMGEQDDSSNPSAAVPHSNPEEQARLDGKRRQRDAAEQQHATRALRNIEAGALQESPEDAGHPEKHRVLQTGDYPAPEPPVTRAADSPTSSFMEPQIADGLPWLGINSSGININNSSIPDDDASLGESPIEMLAAAATAAAAADAAASAAAAAAAAASAAVDAGAVVSEVGGAMSGRAVEGGQQAAVQQQQQLGDLDVPASAEGSGLEPWPKV